MKNGSMRSRMVSLTLAAAVGIGMLSIPYLTGEEAPIEVKGAEKIISRASVHDPSIVKGHDDTYYVFGSHIGEAVSKDLVNWKEVDQGGYKVSGNLFFGNMEQNLKEPFKWAGKDDSDCEGGWAVWAPDVKYNPDYINKDGSKGAWMMYFCTSSTYCRSVIAYAVSDKIDGTYTYKKCLVYSGFTQGPAYDSKSTINKIYTNTNIDELMEEGRIEEGFDSNWASPAIYKTDYAPNAIDPEIFWDKDGRMWMTYGSWSGGIYLLEIDPATGDAIYPGTTSKTSDGRVIDKYFGYRIAGGHTKSGEGPYIVYDKNTGYYYLYTTYNYLSATSGYNMRLFRAKDPTGPYQDAKGNNAVFESSRVDQSQIGIKVMGNYYLDGAARTAGYRSPGHCSSLIDDDGQMYLVYHTRFGQGYGEAFQLRIHQQFMNENGWPVTAVYENRGDKIRKTGYSSDDIVGVYEFINHGTASDNAAVKKAGKVVLLSNGKIKGAYTGTWKEKDNTCYATIKLGSTTYKGVFFKQHDETGTGSAMMTFTAIGSNNQTIWGARRTTFTDESGASYKITKLTKSGGTVTYVAPKSKAVSEETIPASIKVGGLTFKVTAIADKAFAGCSVLSKVTIGKNISSIGRKAFYKDSRLETIKVKTKKLTRKSVGSSAFSGIASTAKVKVPAAKKAAYKKIFKAAGLKGKNQTVS